MMTTIDAIADKSLKTGFDAVLTVHDYYDQPRSGVANFRGVPHYFECIFDDSLDEYSDCYRLTPLSGEVLSAAIQIWQEFLRWRAAFNSGRTDLGTHPALPEEIAKYEVQMAEVKRALASEEAGAVRARGEFAVVAHSTPPWDALTPWQVKWRDH